MKEALYALNNVQAASRSDTARTQTSAVKKKKAARHTQQQQT